MGRLAIAIGLVLGLAACGKDPKVKLVGSSCQDPATCTAECNDGVVVACDRGGELSRDPTEKATLFGHAFEKWESLCEFGNPEACMSGATDALRARGVDHPTIPEMRADPKACKLIDIYQQANGQASQPCP